MRHVLSLQTRERIVLQDSAYQLGSKLTDFQHNVTVGL
jgi:hypothetical protein